MRLGQIVVLVVGIVVLVFVVSFAGQYVRRGGKASTPKGAEAARLTFPVTNAGKKSPLDLEEKSIEWEWQAEGHYNFWFTNDTAGPLKVGVARKGCTCSSVLVCLAPDGVKELSEEERAKRAEESGLPWEALENDHQSVTVPPGAGGWVRLGWKGKEPGSKRMTALMWFGDPDSGNTQQLEVPVNLVHPVRVFAGEQPGQVEASVDKLNAGDQATVTFIVWSSTRPKFALKPAPLREDPCLSYGKPEPLTSEELEKKSQEFKTPVLCGYKATVTLREQADDEHRLDLGPFRRRITWATDVADEPATGFITGQVVSEEVSVDTGAERNRPPIVELNVSRGLQGLAKFTVESRVPDVELRPDETRTADFLKVEVGPPEDGAVRQWRVTASFRPESGFRGPFPDRERPGYESTAIYLNLYRKGESSKTAAKPWRRIRVPVMGFVPS
ncbi:MAG TPA: hypothetical protein VFA26_13470 [Gemmataceae bacterium]|nr:hypothetical protein [Gemmataceae bacterium]